MGAAEPERELIRRVMPIGLSALPLALMLGVAIGGWGAGWSAAIGVGIVLANFAVNGWSLGRAARISLTVLFAVGLGGFVVRLGVILAVMAALNQLPFFSPLAFGIAVVPSTILLLAYEMRLLSGGLWAQLWIPETQESAVK